MRVLFRPTHLERVCKVSLRIQGLTSKKSDDYLKLIVKFPLVSIRSATHFQKAQSIIDELLALEKLSAGELLYLDALSDLVATYEDEAFPIDRPSDAAILSHLMDAKGVSQAEVCQGAGISKSTVSEVLSGKRRISRIMAGKLATFFHVDKSVLMVNF